MIEEVVATDEEEAFRSMSTYHNPTEGSVCVELNGFAGEEIQLELTNPQGQRLYTGNFESLPASNWKTEIDLSQLPQGMYFVRMTSENKVWVNEVVKL